MTAEIETRQSATGLLPCPFCDSIDLELISVLKPANLPLCIQCKTCGATGPLGDTEEVLRETWGVAA